MTFEIQKVSVDYKTIIGEVYANAKTRVTLLTAVALDSPEIAPVMEFDFTADALGVGEFGIVVPTSGGFSFSFRLPDFKVYTAVVGYTGVTAVPLADILADSYTPPDEAVLESYLKKDGDTATNLVDNPAPLVAAVSTATYDINSLLYRHVELTLDHATPAITISGAVTGSGLVIWLIQGAAGTAVVDLAAFDFGDGAGPTLSGTAGDTIGFVATYVAGSWLAMANGVTF